MQFPLTISISVQNRHSRILLRALLRGRMREMRREPEVPEARVPVGRMSRLPCKDYLKGTCTNSFCEKWHPPECLFYKSENGCRFGKTALLYSARLMNGPAKGLKRMVTKVQWLCWRRNEHHQRTVRLVMNAYSSNTRQLGLRIPGYGAAEVFIDFTEELRHAETNPTCEIHESYCTSTLNKIRDQNPSLEENCPGEPHQRSPNAPKYEDRSQEETERQERCARGSSVEAGQKNPKIKGKKKSSILLTFGK